MLPDGTTVDVRVVPSKTDETVAEITDVRVVSCILGIIRRQRFPTARSGIEVVYPFAFKR